MRLRLLSEERYHIVNDDHAGGSSMKSPPWVMKNAPFAFIGNSKQQLLAL